MRAPWGSGFILLLLLLCIANKSTAQKLLEYGYSSNAVNISHGSGFMVDSLNRASLLAFSRVVDGEDNFEWTNSSGEHILQKLDTRSRYHSMLLQNVSGKVSVIAPNPDIYADDHSAFSYSFSKNGLNYFIWLYPFDSSQSTFLGQKLDFRGKFGGDYPIQIIVTDHLFKVIRFERIQFMSTASLILLEQIQFTLNCG